LEGIPKGAVRFTMQEGETERGKLRVVREREGFVPFDCGE